MFTEFPAVLNLNTSVNTRQLRQPQAARSTSRVRAQDEGLTYIKNRTKKKEMDVNVVLMFLLAHVVTHAFAENGEAGLRKPENALEDAEHKADFSSGPILDDLTADIEKKTELLQEFINETATLDVLNVTSHPEDDNVTFNETEEEFTKRSNETEPEKSDPETKIKWHCSLMSIDSTEEESKVVLLKNDSQLTNFITKSNESHSCFLLYFYVRWCEFCADIAAEINAIGRIYYGLPVLAVDAYSLSSIAGKFGITGVPTLLLFYKGRPVAKFNRSRSLQGLEDFISKSTGLKANLSMEIHDEDFIGPIPTKIDDQGDIYLTWSLVSIVVIIVINWCLTQRVQSFITTSFDRFKRWALHEKTD